MKRKQKNVHRMLALLLSMVLCFTMIQPMELRATDGQQKDPVVEAVEERGAEETETPDEDESESSEEETEGSEKDMDASDAEDEEASEETEESEEVDSDTSDVEDEESLEEEDIDSSDTGDSEEEIEELEEAVNGEETGVVVELQARIDALPSVEDVQKMSDVEKDALMEDMIDIMDQLEVFFEDGIIDMEQYEAMAVTIMALNDAMIGDTPTSMTEGTSGIETVCKIGESAYPSLSAAIAASTSGDTIWMTADDSNSQQIEINKSVTIELQGFALNSTTFKITGSDTVVTLNDRIGSAKINTNKNTGFTATENSRCDATIYITDEAALTINGFTGTSDVTGTIISECKNRDLEKAIFLGNGKLTINGGTFVGTKASGCDAVFIYNGTVTINDGYFYSNCALSYQTAPSDSNPLLIKKGVFDGGMWLESSGSINGQTFTRGTQSVENVKKLFLSSSGSTVLNGSTESLIKIGSGLFVSDSVGSQTLPDGSKVYVGGTDANNPELISVDEGTKLILQPQILGGDGSSEISYEWKKDGILISDATGNSYIIDNYNPTTDNGNYTLTASQGTESITLYYSVGSSLNSGGHTHPICDASCTHNNEHTDLTFQPWDSDNSLPIIEGNYYLTKDITITDTRKSIPAEGETILCLNGHKILNTNGAVIEIKTNTAVSICDCSADESGYVSSQRGNYGKPIFLINEGMLKLYSGKLDNPGTDSWYYSVKVQNGNFYMYGGTITCAGGAPVFISGTNCTADIFGGQIYTNTNSCPGVQNINGGKLSISGGSVSNSKGTAIVQYGENSVTTISGGTISTDASNAYVINTQNNVSKPGGRISISGGLLRGAGGIYCQNTDIVITGGTIESTDNYAVVLCSEFDKLYLGGAPTLSGVLKVNRANLISAKYQESVYSGTEVNVNASLLNNGDVVVSDVTDDNDSKFKLTDENKILLRKDDNLVIHIHDYQYSASDNEITAQCNNSGCPYGSDELKLTITANTMDYSGNVYSGVCVTNNISSVTGAVAGDIMYYAVDENGNITGEEIEEPINAGKYVATVTMNGTKAVARFEIRKLSISPTVNLLGWVKYSVPNTPTITGNTGGGQVTYSYKKEFDTEYTVVTDFTTIPAGKYTFRAIIAATTNYNAGEATCTFTVSKAPITGVSVAGIQKTYDGNFYSISVTKPEDATIRYRTSETGDYTLNENPKFKDAGTYTVYYKVEKGEDYEPVAGSAQVIISEKTVTIAGTTVKATKEYDGTTIAKITNNGELFGTVENDVLTIKGGTALYSDKNIGNGKTVTFSGFELDGAAKDNYVLSAQPADTTANITAKVLTVRDVQICDKQYDGKNTAAYVGSPGLNDVVSGDDVTLINGEPTFQSVNVENNISIIFTPFTLSGRDCTNYTLIQPNGVTANIYNNFVPNKGTEYTVTSNDWTNRDFIITAKDGYSISLTDSADGSWTNQLTESEETATGKIIFYVKNNVTDAISKAVQESYKIDKTVPTGDIKVGENSIKKLINQITFGWFFKNHIDVMINSNDTMSGIKSVEYQKVARESDYSENGSWIVYTSLSVEANDKSIYYARITDNAGNVTIINSDGVVVYKDASDTDSLEYTRTTKSNVTSQIELFGNTVKSIKNGDTVLTERSAYTVADGKIILQGDYLETLAAGSYTLKVSYYPLGEIYTPETSKGEDAKDSNITLTVKKADAGSAGTEINNDPSKTYDGKTELDVQTYSKSSGTPTVEYKKKGAADSVYTTEKPKDAGEYTIRVTYPEDENYEESSATKDFAIIPKDISGTTVNLGETLIYNGQELTQNVSKVVLDGEEITFTVENNKATAAGTYELTIKGTGNYSGEIKVKYVIVALDEKVDEIGEGTSGEVKMTVSVGEKAPATTIQSSKSEMIQMVATADELSKVASGDTLNIWLEVKDASNTITEESKQQIVAKIKGFTAGHYMDISLFKKLASESGSTQIVETGKPIRIEITVPEELLNRDGSISRQYAIVRNHGGQVEILPATFNAGTHILIFETDKFSDYGIIYKDTRIPDNSSSSNDSSQNNEPTYVGIYYPTQPASKPATGDSANAAAWLAILGICFIGLAGTAAYTRKKRNK